MMIKNGSKRLFFYKKDLAVMATKATIYVTLGEIKSPNTTNTINSNKELIMLKNSIGHFDPQIKSNLNSTDSSHDVLAGLSYIRHRNEQLAEELDDTLVRFESAMAQYRADAYAS